MNKISCVICDRELITIEGTDYKITYKGGFGIKCVSCTENDGRDKLRLFRGGMAK